MLSDDLVDAWGRFQCVGAPGLRDRGTTAPTVYAPPEQRLDYFFRSATSTLAVQHLYIDYELSSVPAGINGVSYLSDHRPLGCDLNVPQSNCTPPEALVAVVNAAGHFRNHDSRPPAGVKWFRFDAKGTYEFRVDSRFPVGFAVYLDTDLSRPREQYRKEFQPDFGVRYVLASAPFLVKVFCTNRATEYEFDFRAHQHRGTSIDDAIDIVPENAQTQTFPAGQLLDLDQTNTPWNDIDSTWFRLDTPLTRVGGPIQLGVDVTPTANAEGGVRVYVGLLESNGTLGVAGQAGPSSGSLSVRWQAGSGERFFVAVQRLDRAGAALSFDIVPRTNVSILLGGQTGSPRLVCQDETSGWGSDDIALSIEADDVTVRDISNDEIGDFDQDDVRDLDQWVPQTLVYLDHVGITVIEEDAVDPDDVGTGRIPPIGALAAAPGIAIDETLPDGSVKLRLGIDVDDGTYEFRAALTRWHEKA